MSPSTTSLLVLAATIVLFVWNRLPVGVVAVLTALALYVTGLVDATTALAGFGDPVVVFIASLFIVSEALDATGVTTWAGQRLVAVVGDGPMRVLVAVLALCALLTAVITLNGSVAALLPMVLVLALKIGTPPSRMLMPMAFAGQRRLAAGADRQPRQRHRLGGRAGRRRGRLRLLLVCRHRRARSSSAPSCSPSSSDPGCCPCASRRTLRATSAATPAHLAEHYELHDGFYRLRVRPGSPLEGTATADLDLTAYPGLVLIGLQSGGGPHLLGRARRRGRATCSSSRATRPR